MAQVILCVTQFIYFLVVMVAVTVDTLKNPILLHSKRLLPNVPVTVLLLWSLVKYAHSHGPVQPQMSACAGYCSLMATQVRYIM